MIVVMQAAANEEQIQHVVDRLVALGFDIHRSTGASQTVLGAGHQVLVVQRGGDHDPTCDTADDEDQPKHEVRDTPAPRCVCQARRQIALALPGHGGCILVSRSTPRRSCNRL